MVLTNSQVKSFFEDATQMAIPNATMTRLGNEGISRPDDLEKVTNETMKQIVTNLRAEDMNYIFRVNSHRQILVVSDAIQYYEETGRVLTAGNLQWNPVLKSFES